MKNRIREVETERKIEVFHLLVHSANGPKGLRWALSKLRARSFFQVSHVGAGALGLGPPSTAFPGHQQGARLEVEQLRVELVPTWDVGAAGRGLNPLCHSTSLG